jgi:hypothetical protein
MQRHWDYQETQQALDHFFSITCGLCGKNNILCERHHNIQEGEDYPGKVVDGYEINMKDEDFLGKGFRSCVELFLLSLNPAFCCDCAKYVGSAYKRLEQAIRDKNESLVVATIIELNSLLASFLITEAQKLSALADKKIREAQKTINVAMDLRA